MNYELKEKGVARAIVATVAYFDIFDYPLTSFEIGKFLLKEKCALTNVLSALNSGLLNNIESKNGFYFLQGRSGIIKERMARYNLADRKIKRALWVTKLFKLIPGLKMVAVSNIMGAHNMREESDIDLFIITEQGKIWLTRFFCVAITQLLGLRPSLKKARDKICLSFFISEEAMNLENLMIQGAAGTKSLAGGLVTWGEEDIYFIYWLAGLVPIYDRDNTYNKFMRSNEWIKKYLPNFFQPQMSLLRKIEPVVFKTCHHLINWLISWLERYAKIFQLKIMPQTIKEIMNKDSRVVVNDKILKFHINDRRECYYKQFIERLKDWKI